MKDWAQMPTARLRNKAESPLLMMKDLMGTGKYQHQYKSDQMAALILYMVLLHHINDEPTAQLPRPGMCALTYTELSSISGLSRAKVSGGLKMLESLRLISITSAGRNQLYEIIDYGQSQGWAKLPAKGLYTRDLKKHRAFEQFKLRSKNELNALKIYLILVTFRSRIENYTRLSYERIEEYTGVPRKEIKAALSFLINSDFLYVNREERAEGKTGMINLYKIRFLEPARKERAEKNQTTAAPREFVATPGAYWGG